MSDRKSLSRSITTNAQLLVEGRTPEIFFREMVEYLGLADRIQVRDFGSISDLTDYLKDFTQKADFIETVTSLGIIRDAEDKPASSGFDSVCHSLKTAGITPPEKIGEVEQKTIKVGVFILPDCQNEGMIETLCLDSVANEASALQCVNDYFNCLKAKSVTWPANITKAKTWAFLATKDISDPQVGRAAQTKIWHWDANAFEKLRNFLKDLAQS